MEVAAPPAGYQLVELNPVLVQQAMGAHAQYQAVIEQLRLALFNRGVMVAMNGRFPVEALEEVEAALLEHAQEGMRLAVEPILGLAGVADLNDIRLVVQRDGLGNVVGVDVYRPMQAALDEPMYIHMSMVNSTAENTNIALLPIEDSSLNTNQDGGLSTGQIVGITVGSVAGLSLIVAASLYLWRRRRGNKKSPTSYV